MRLHSDSKAFADATMPALDLCFIANPPSSPWELAKNPSAFSPRLPSGRMGISSQKTMPGPSSSRSSAAKWLALGLRLKLTSGSNINSFKSSEDPGSNPKASQRRVLISSAYAFLAFAPFNPGNFSAIVDSNSCSRRPNRVSASAAGNPISSSPSAICFSSSSSTSLPLPSSSALTAGPALGCSASTPSTPRTSPCVVVLRSCPTALSTRELSGSARELNGSVPFFSASSFPFFLGRSEPLNLPT